MNAPVNQPKKTQKKFDKTFKQYAVDLCLNSGMAAAEVATELGIQAQRLTGWRKRRTIGNREHRPAARE